jgi:hypothetical protein
MVYPMVFPPPKKKEICNILLCGLLYKIRRIRNIGELSAVFEIALGFLSKEQVELID